MSKKRHRTTFRVLFGDVDAMNVVYYANYLRFFERGRAELMRTAGAPYQNLTKEGLHLVVTRTEVQYLKPAFYDDEIIIQTHVDWIKRASCQFAYTIFRTNGAGEDLLAEGVTAHGCVTMGGKVAPLPEWVVSNFRQYAN